MRSKSTKYKTRPHTKQLIKSSDAYISSLEANVHDLEEKLRHAQSAASSPFEISVQPTQPRRLAGNTVNPGPPDNNDRSGDDDNDELQEGDGFDDSSLKDQDLRHVEDVTTQAPRNNNLEKSNLFFTTPQGTMRFYGMCSLSTSYFCLFFLFL